MRLKRVASELMRKTLWIKNLTYQSWLGLSFVAHFWNLKVKKTVLDMLGSASIVKLIRQKKRQCLNNLTLTRLLNVINYSGQESFGKHLCQSLFLIKLQGAAYNFITKETLAQVFSCEFCENFENTFSERTPFLKEYLRCWLLLRIVDKLNIEKGRSIFCDGAIKLIHEWTEPFCGQCSSENTTKPKLI